MTPKVLVIDDEELICNSMAEYLTIKGIEAKSAISAQRALEMTENHDFDLYIVDIKMKNTDGLSTIVKLKKVNNDARFIIFTGSRTFKVPEELMTFGITDQNVVFKPLIDLNLMVQKINEIMNQ